MPLSDIYSNALMVSRWLHVLLGMLWIGDLYYFDLVTLPVARTLPSAYVSRSLNWLRWLSTLAVLSGIVLLAAAYLYVPGKGIGPSAMLIDNGEITDRALWVFFGMILAVLMWFQVWFVAVPLQKKLLAGGWEEAEGRVFQRRSAAAVRRATVLSGPMLFGMLAPSHYGPVDLKTVLIVLLAGISAVALAARLIGR